MPTACRAKTTQAACPFRKITIKAQVQPWTLSRRRYAERATSRTRQLKRRWPSYLGLAGVGLAIWAVYTYRKSEDESQCLNPATFTAFTLAGKEAVSSTSSIFTLKPLHKEAIASPYQEVWRKGIWSVQIKQPQLQITRAYTPLPPIQASNDSKSEELHFLIRRDPEGEVSGYMHKLALNAEIEIRGPHLQYEIPQDVEEIVFLAGGTGIAPALQAAHSLLEVRAKPPDHMLKIHILWACRRREDSAGGNDKLLHNFAKATNSWTNFLNYFMIFSPRINVSQSSYRTPIVRDLDSLVERHDQQVGVEYFVDDEKRYITKLVLEQYLQTQNNEVPGSQRKPSNALRNKKVILVSGPDGFINYFAGPKTWHEGQEVQGRLGGILKAIKPMGWEVWKL